MSETITPSFKKELEKHSFPVIYTLYYKRRYWSTNSYIWETDWTEVDTSMISSLGNLSQRLDKDQLNEFLTSNCTITLSNKNEIWNEGTVRSLFNIDDVATAGYIPYLTKFQLRGGLEVNGTVEALVLFTGYAVKFQTQSKDNLVQISLEGRDRILKNASAEKVSTYITGETPTGLINSTNKDFYTVHPGVGRIDYIEVDGVEIEIGTGCTISDTEDKDVSAKISLKYAPISSIIIDYFYYYQNKTFEELFALLLNEAGLTSEEYEIGKVAFQTDVIVKKTFGTQAEWDQCSKINIDTLTNINALKIGCYDDFSDGDATQNPDNYFPTSYNSSYTDTVENDCLKTVLTQTTGVDEHRIVFISTSIYGSWCWQYSTGSPGVDPAGHTLILQQRFVFNISPTGEELIIAIGRLTDLGVNNQLGIITQSFGGTKTILYSTPYMPNINDIFRVDITVLGVVSIYKNGTLLLSFTYSPFIGVTTHSVYVHSTYELQNPVAGTPSGIAGSYYLKNVYHWAVGTTPGIGIATSYAIDCGPDVYKYLNIAYNFKDNKINGASIKIETLSSSSIDFSTGLDPAGWLELADYISGSIRTTLVQRYIKFKITLTMPNIDISLASPILEALSLSYATNTTSISFANFNGKTIFDAISELAKMPDYEIGFNSSEKFFVRQKATTSVPIEIDENNSLIDIVSITPDITKVKNDIRVTYGDYMAFSNSILNEDPHPHSIDKYGIRTLNISGSSLLLDDSVNISIGIANSFYDRYNQLREYVQIKTKFLPQITLSDVINLKFDPRLDVQRIYWDDDISAWDDGTLRWDGNRFIPKAYTKYKIISIILNTNNSIMTIDAEKII